MLWLYANNASEVGVAKRTLFIVSDRTGITAETLAHTLLTQFDLPVDENRVFPFCDSREKLDSVIAEVRQATATDTYPPLVFSSLVDDDQRALLRDVTQPGLLLDYFEIFLPLLKDALHQEVHAAKGLSHGIGNAGVYEHRIDAVNFALGTDDGLQLKSLGQADVVLVGVSRSGKTPISLYLALQYGVWAANYPLTEEDLGTERLPGPLVPVKDKLVGLTIDLARLQAIREQRRPGSDYASAQRCRHELSAAEHMFKVNHLPFLDATSMSIEEIAAAIMQRKGLQRRV